MCWNFVCLDLMHMVKGAVSSWVPRSCHVKQILFEFRYPLLLDLIVILPSLTEWLLRFGWREYDMDSPFRAKYSTASYSWHLTTCGETY